MPEQTENQPENQENPEQITPEDKAQKMEQYRADLTSKPTDELVDMLLTVNKESKTRKYENKELREQLTTFEQKVKEVEESKRIEEEEMLKKNNEYKTLYDKLLETTSDYEDLKAYKMQDLERAKMNVEEMKNGLTKGEAELFDLASSNMPYNEQLEYINKLIGQRSSTVLIDKAQGVSRAETEKSESSGSVAFGSGSLTGNLLKGLKNLR